MDESIPLKRCKSCGDEFPATTDHFGNRKASKDGLQYSCKMCRQARENQRVLDIQLQRINSPVEATKKRCTVCKDEKSLDEENFSKNYRTKDGWHYTCKACESTLAHKTYIKNQEDRKRRVREYARKNRLIKRARDRAYNRSHAEKIRARSREYRHTHAEAYHQYSREYAKSHRQQRRVHERNRRARLRNGGTHTLQDIINQYARQKGRCYYCKCKVSWGKHHVDHIIPTIRGGSNGPDNLVITCSTCNLRKREKLPHEWPDGGRLL